MPWIWEDDKACERANQLYSRLAQRWYAEGGDFLRDLSDRAYKILMRRTNEYLINKRNKLLPKQAQQ